MTRFLRSAALAFLSLGAAAETPKGESRAIANNIATSCKEDRAKFCADVKPGGGRIQACYEAHKDQLSKACTEARAAARAAEKASK
ncbi:MAG: cysteine rich repeat-containing protein [Deltaproteobacteria bacterium]|nr:cysteine rich repeat-containing protein [Deltaproteobacteria bacterium]